MSPLRWLAKQNATLLAAIALAGLSGCGERTSAVPSIKAEDSSAPRRLRVTAAKPMRKTIRRTSTQPGYIEAFEQSRVYAKLPAFVAKYHVDIGDIVTGPRWDAKGNLVQQGQLLAQLSAPEMDHELQQRKALVAQASADVEQAQAVVKLAQADTLVAQARLKEATAAADRYEAEFQRWTSEYDRVVQLVSRSAVTQKLADETKAQKLAADAARNEAQAKIESARAAVAASQAQIDKTLADEAATRARREVAEAQQARAAALLDYLRIEAPFDGTITERNVDTGDFASPPAGTAARPLFVVVRTDRVRVFVDLPEADAALADVKDRATIRIQALDGYDFPGTVTRTSWALDPTTRTLHTEIDVPNEDGKLRPGMYAQVTIELAEREEACVVPATAVFAQEGGTWCLVVEDGKAARRAVQPGLKSAGEVEIVSGLRGDELVIQGNGASIADAQEVELGEPVKGK